MSAAFGMIFCGLIPSAFTAKRCWVPTSWIFTVPASAVIELDGSLHAQPDAVLRDAEHTAFLQSYGLQVLRIPNPDVRRHFSAVCALIDLTVQQALRQQEK